MPTGKEIDAQLAGKPPGWYHFDNNGTLLDGGPYDDEWDTLGDTSRWAGQWDPPHLDISYAPEGIN